MSEQVAKTTHKRIIQGRVASNKATQTIIVAVERQVMHPLYKKYFKSTKKFMAHDPEETCNIGDIVRIKECRPLSARKRWMFDSVVSRAK
jgi:small subunit ribosomal protein S17